MTIRLKILLLIASVSLITGFLGLYFFRQSISNADDIAKHEARAIADTIAFELTADPWGRPEGSHAIND